MWLVVLLSIVFLEIYTAFLIVYFLVKTIRRNKLPYPVLLVELVCLVLAFYFKHLVNNHELLFTGQYENNPEDWGAGLSNASTYLFNTWILISIFAVSQIVFWVVYLHEYRKLNERKATSLKLLTNIESK